MIRLSPLSYPSFIGRPRTFCSLLVSTGHNEWFITLSVAAAVCLARYSAGEGQECEVTELPSDLFLRSQSCTAPAPLVAPYRDQLCFPISASMRDPKSRLIALKLPDHSDLLQASMSSFRTPPVNSSSRHFHYIN